MNEMKAKKCIVLGNTAWGYCFTPIPFPSIAKGKQYAREMVDEGYWFNYRVKVLK